MKRSVVPGDGGLGGPGPIGSEWPLMVWRWIQRSLRRLRGR